MYYSIDADENVCTVYPYAKGERKSRAAGSYIGKYEFKYLYSFVDTHGRNDYFTLVEGGNSSA